MAEKQVAIKSTPRQGSEITTRVKPEKPVSEIRTVVVELPLGAVADTEYLSRHVESYLSTPQQQRAAKRLLRGLQGSGAKTRDGRPVERPGQVVRWLFEQISDSE